MFEGFERVQIETTGTTVNLVHGGRGAPVLLLHGYPQTHVMWHKISPRMADRFTVVAPDLRGYGDSGKPPAEGDLSVYCKRTTAQDQVEVMASGSKGSMWSGTTEGPGWAIGWRSTIRTRS